MSEPARRTFQKTIVDFDTKTHIDGYVMSTEGADYVPNDFERSLIADAVEGVLSELCIELRGSTVVIERNILDKALRLIEELSAGLPKITLSDYSILNEVPITIEKALRETAVFDSETPLKEQAYDLCRDSIYDFDSLSAGRKTDIHGLVTSLLRQAQRP